MSVNKNGQAIKTSPFELVSHSPADTRRLGVRIGKLAAAGDVYLLTGNLGAGKTCLTQGIASGLDIKEYTLSPSFVIMRELHGRLPLYHADLYRLENLNEIADLGLDDYFYGRGVCVVEWAERALELLPPEHLLINLGHMDAKQRLFRFEPKGRRYQQLATEIKRILIEPEEKEQ